MEQPPQALQIGVVVVIEGIGGGDIEVIEDAAISALRATLLQCGEVGGVQRWIRIACAAEVVEPLAEGPTLCTPKGVSSCNLQFTIYLKLKSILYSCRHYRNLVK